MQSFPKGSIILYRCFVRQGTCINQLSALSKCRFGQRKLLPACEYTINKLINDKKNNQWRREVGTKFKVEEGTSLNRKQVGRRTENVAQETEVAMRSTSCTFSLAYSSTRSWPGLTTEGGIVLYYSSISEFIMILWAIVWSTRPRIKDTWFQRTSKHHRAENHTSLQQN